MKQYLSIILLIISALSQAMAQKEELGLPFITNYEPFQYKASMQNWAVVQDRRDVMYFGNNRGVLEYDGVNWNLITVSNSSLVRSLAIDSAGTVYVGAVGEFGYLSPDSTGKLAYHSLISKIEEEGHTFADVWSTLTIGDEVYFQSYNVLFRYKNGKIKSWTLTNSYHRSFIVNNELYLREEGKGLMVMENDSLVPVKGGAIFSKEPVSAMLPFKGKILIGTRNLGLFLFDPSAETITSFHSQASTFLTKNLLYHGAILSNGDYVFSTLKNGIIRMNEEGKVLLHLNNNSGLSSKTIYYLFSDKNGSLWLGNEIGISKIEITAPVTVFDKILGLDGVPLATTRFEGRLFVTTQQGVFFLNEEYYFEQVKNLYYLCWQIENFNLPDKPGKQKLLVASIGGIFEVSRKGEVQLVREGRIGAIKASTQYPARVYFGNYGEIGSLRYQNGSWVEEATLKVASDEIRGILEDAEGNIWLSTMYSGIYKIKTADWNSFVAGENKESLNSITRYGVRKGLPTDNGNILNKVDQKLVINNYEGFYCYNKGNDTFEKEVPLNNAFAGKKRSLHYLHEDKDGNLWFDSDKGKGCLIKKDSSYILSESPFVHLAISPEKVGLGYAEDNGIVWFGTSDGLFRYDSNAFKNDNTSFRVLIRKVSIGKDSLLFQGAYFNEDQSDPSNRVVSLTQPLTFKKKLDYKYNSIAFHYT